MPLLAKMMDTAEKFNDKAIEFAQEQVARREEEEDQPGYVPKHKSIVKKAVEATEDFIAEQGSPRSRSRSSSSSDDEVRDTHALAENQQATRLWSLRQPRVLLTQATRPTTALQVIPGKQRHNSYDGDHTGDSRNGSTSYERRTVEVSSSYPQDTFTAANPYDSNCNVSSSYSHVSEEVDSYTTSSVYRPPYDRNEDNTNTEPRREGYSCYERNDSDNFCNNAGASSSYSSRVDEDISYSSRTGTGLGFNSSRENTSSYRRVNEEDDVSYDAFNKLSLESSSCFERSDRDTEEYSRYTREDSERFIENNTYGSSSSRFGDSDRTATSRYDTSTYPGETRESDSYSYSSSREYSRRSGDADASYNGRNFTATGPSAGFNENRVNTSEYMTQDRVSYSREVVSSTRTQNYENYIHQEITHDVLAVTHETSWILLGHFSFCHVGPQAQTMDFFNKAKEKLTGGDDKSKKDDKKDSESIFTKAMDAVDKYHVKDKAVEYAQKQVAKREEEKHQPGYVEKKDKSIVDKAKEAAEDFLAKQGDKPKETPVSKPVESRSRSSSSSSSSSSDSEKKRPKSPQNTPVVVQQAIPPTYSSSSEADINGSFGRMNLDSTSSMRATPVVQASTRLTRSIGVDTALSRTLKRNRVTPKTHLLAVSKLAPRLCDDRNYQGRNYPGGQYQSSEENYHQSGGERNFDDRTYPNGADWGVMKVLKSTMANREVKVGTTRAIRVGQPAGMAKWVAPTRATPCPTETTHRTTMCEAHIPKVLDPAPLSVT
ncbi:hypothetical protein GQ600_12216 [Phytophthora cactorum]|nr:hypothetical protein GQ600_12216 [Phytophthora cactorum]